MQKIGGIDERKVIGRLKHGDQIAFEMLFRHYYAGLVVFASQITLDEDEATEIVQNFFVRLWEKRKDINDEKSIKSYLFTSIKNRSINFLKKRNTDEKFVKEMNYLAQNHQLYEPDIFVESELRKKIEGTIEKMPNRCGEIFILSRFNGLSNNEIAEKLNISKRTVENQITNALKILRIELKDYVGLLVLLSLLN